MVPLGEKVRRWGCFVAGVAVLALWAGAGAQVAGSAVWLNLSDAHYGAVTDRSALHSALGDLGALTEGAGAVVVSVFSLDSMNPQVSPMARGAMEVIGRAAREAGGEAQVFVAAPWGRLPEREARGSFFPTTPEELEAQGYDWLLEPDGFRLVWDHDSKVAELTVPRSFMYGRETLSGVVLYLCVDGETVRGWARSWAYRGSREPTDATVGRFTRDCLHGALGMPDEYVVPAETRASLGLEGWFAVLLPNAVTEHVPLGVAIDSARELLALANVPIPLHVVAVETVNEDTSVYVTREEHEAMLAELGVSVDPAFQAGLPAWVRDFATGSGTVLVLFDDAGRAVGHFGIALSNPLGRETMVETLMHRGLF